MRGIAGQNYNPGRTAFLGRKRGDGTEALLDPWRVVKLVPPPEEVNIRVEVRNHTGPYKLPCEVRVVRGQVMNATTGRPLTEINRGAVTLVRWRPA